MLKFHFACPQREICIYCHAQLSLYKGIKKNGKVKKESNSPVTNQLTSLLQLKEPIKLLVGS